MVKKILVSQPKPASDKSPYYDIANEFGVELVFRPFIKVEGLTSKEFRQQKVSILNYTAVVFTSRHAIDNYFKLAKEMRLEIPEDMKYFCVTEQIALRAQELTSRIVHQYLPAGVVVLKLERNVFLQIQTETPFAVGGGEFAGEVERIQHVADVAGMVECHYCMTYGLSQIVYPTRSRCTNRIQNNVA